MRNQYTGPTTLHASIHYSLYSVTKLCFGFGPQEEKKALFTPSHRQEQGSGASRTTIPPTIRTILYLKFYFHKIKPIVSRQVSHKSLTYYFFTPRKALKKKAFNTYLRKAAVCESISTSIILSLFLGFDFRSLRVSYFHSHTLI